MPNKINIYRYRLWCTTENKYEYSWDINEPTSCPISGAHSLDSNRTAIIQKITAVQIDNSDNPYKYKKHALIVDTSSGDVTVNLKTANRINWPIIIINVSDTNTLTIQTPDEALIDGNSIKTVNNIVTYVLESNGSTWTSTPSHNFREQLNDTEITNMSTVVNGDGKGDLLVDDGEELTYLETGNDGEFLQLFNLSEEGVRWTNLNTLVQNLSNKTISANDNTISDLTDTCLASNAALDASKIADGSVGNTEFQTLNGITSNIQSQLDVDALALTNHISDSINPHNVTKIQVGLGNLENILHNYNATTNPTSDNNSLDGYSIGSRWLNLNSTQEWLLIGETSQIAEWLEISNLVTNATNLGSGSGGIGIFSQLSSTELQFKSLKSMNNLLTVTDNTGDGTLDLTINQANFTIPLTDLSDISISGLAIGDVLQYNGSNWENSQVSGGGTTIGFDAYYEIANSSDSEDDISYSWNDVPLTNERYDSGHFTHSNNSAQVTFNTTGTFLIQARCTTYISSGSSRSCTYMRLSLDTGSGYNEVQGSYATMYNRTKSQGYNTGNVSLILNISTGNKLKIQVAKISGSSILKLFSDACSLTIVKI